MKTLWAGVAIIFVLGMAGLAGATSLVCDPQNGIDYYIVTGLPSTIDGSKVSPDSTGAYGFKLDISTIPAGEYTVTAQACSELWGCSAVSNPFSFTRPTLQAPGTGRLIP